MYQQSRQNQSFDSGYYHQQQQRPTSPQMPDPYGRGGNGQTYSIQSYYSSVGNISDDDDYYAHLNSGGGIRPADSQLIDDDYDSGAAGYSDQRSLADRYRLSNKYSYNNNYNDYSNQNYNSGGGGAPPPNTLLLQGGQTYMMRNSSSYSNASSYSNDKINYEKPSSYDHDGITYQRPSGAPPLPHHGRYQKQGGIKKALIIGINYIGSKNQLRGCINDAHNMYNFLVKNGYPAENIVTLTDDQKQAVGIPTKVNILRAMEWLVGGARPGDCLFFHYSGHGGQEEDDGSQLDEIDGYDDCIYPVDFKQRGSIIDDTLHDILVKPLVKGVRLTCIFDSCHSGSVLDLPFAYKAQDGGIKEYNIWKESQGDALNIVKAYASDNFGAMLASASKVLKRIQANVSVDKDKVIAENTSPADVVMFAGCKDSQTSADANEAGTFTGALSWAFLKVLNENPTQSYLTMLQNIRAVLETKYTQKPQLSTSHEINPNCRYVF